MHESHYQPTPKRSISPLINPNELLNKYDLKNSDTINQISQKHNVDNVNTNNDKDNVNGNQSDADTYDSNASSHNSDNKQQIQQQQQNSEKQNENTNNKLSELPYVPQIARGYGTESEKNMFDTKNDELQFTDKNNDGTFYNSLEEIDLKNSIDNDMETITNNTNANVTTKNNKQQNKKMKISSKLSQIKKFRMRNDKTKQNDNISIASFEIETNHLELPRNAAQS